ncbi:MAG: class I SAM-dependent methyltransferase [Candidatus Paceibacterota bacterium]
MPKFHNKTRQAPSIPRKLLKESKFYLLPIYYLLLTSELAREGIKNSGSYNFADHIYGNKPKGNFIIGKILDSVLLNLKSARSLRSRYIHAKEEIYNLIANVEHQESIDILAVPCGLGRELFEVAHELQIANHSFYKRIRWHGIDLDHELIEVLKKKNEDYKHQMFFWQGDALNQETYRKNNKFDMIINTGLTEFLSDVDTLRFYKIAHSNLKQGGIFFTSGMRPHRISEYLMKNIAELYTHYRSEDSLKSLARKAGFKTIGTYQNELQTILIGVKNKL